MPNARAIFERLAARPSAVGELAGQLPVRRPAVSQPRRVRKAVGLVVDRAEGTRRIYSIEPGAVAARRGYFDAFWGQALDAFRVAAEADDDR